MLKSLRKRFASKDVKAALGILDELDYLCDSSVFQLPREVVESAILEEQERFSRVLREQGITPRQKVYTMLEWIAGDYVTSGSPDFFVYRGVLNPTGEALLDVYDIIIDQMKKIGCISEEQAHKQRSDVRDRIKEVG